MIWGYHDFWKHPYLFTTKTLANNKPSLSLVGTLRSRKTRTVRGRAKNNVTPMCFPIQTIKSCCRDFFYRLMFSPCLAHHQKTQKSNVSFTPPKNVRETISSSTEGVLIINSRGASTPTLLFLTSWWLNQPIWNICSSKWEIIFPKEVGVKIFTNIWVATTYIVISNKCQLLKINSRFSQNPVPPKTMADNPTSEEKNPPYVPLNPGWLIGILTWRIIPVSNWLVTPIYKPWKGHL